MAKLISSRNKCQYITCRISDVNGSNGDKYLQAFINGMEIDGIVSIEASCNVNERNTVQIIAHCNLENKEENRND